MASRDAHVRHRCHSKGGEQRRLAFDKSDITIGRAEENDVVLPDGDVSRQHARIVFESGQVIIVDRASTNGSYVNGREIRTRRVVEERDEILIGDFTLRIETTGAHAGAVAGAAQQSSPVPDPPWTGRVAAPGPANLQRAAAGVVGTEITIFEPMAVTFGEELLRQFVAGEAIGRAVRRARLALLRQGNPARPGLHSVRAVDAAAHRRGLSAAQARSGAHSLGLGPTAMDARAWSARGRKRCRRTPRP